MKKTTINADKHLIKELQKKLQELSEQLSDVKKESNHYESEYLRLSKGRRDLNAQLFRATELLKESVEALEEKGKLIKELCTFIWGYSGEQTMNTHEAIRNFLFRREEEKRQGKSEAANDREGQINKNIADILSNHSNWKPTNHD